MKRARRLIGPHHAHIAVMGDQTLRYRYRVPGVGRCEFSLLSEVGEPWVHGFRVLLASMPPVFHGVDLPAAPWCADRLSAR